MNRLCWLLTRIVYLMMRTITQMGLLLFGCGVRLLYWSVRTYGWGKVGSFLLAATGSAWFAADRGWLALNGFSFVGLLAGTFGLWGLFLSGAALLGRCWQRREQIRARLTRRELPSPLSLIDSPVEEQTAPATHILPSTQISRCLSDPTVWEQAWQRVFTRGGGPGPDAITVEDFALNPVQRLKQLREMVCAGSYRPRSPRWVVISKPNGGSRRLCILCVGDRIVQQVFLSLLIPVWNPKFAPCSFAYRPGRSAKQAVSSLERELATGRSWIVDADIRSFFDSVPHTLLFETLRAWLSDEAAFAFLMRLINTTAPSPGRGLAQGAPLSPLIANVYLHRFDEALLQAGYHLLRYADDFVIPCATRPQAEQALHMARRLLRRLRLQLQAEKTRIVHRDEGFTFLGWAFDHHGKRPSQAAVEGLQLRLASTLDEEKRQQIQVGWNAYFNDGDQPAGDPSQTEDEPTISCEIDDSTCPEPPSTVLNLTLFRERFMGNPDVFARFWQKETRCGYMPIRRALRDEELHAHLAGELVLGTYLMFSDDQTNQLVLDIDGPDDTKDGQVAAFEVAFRMIKKLKEEGVMPIWEDSAGKGYHLWICFQRPVSARDVRRWAHRWLDGFRPFHKGTQVEVFPKQDRLGPSALGSLMRLPLGRHPITGRWSQILDRNGNAIENPSIALNASPRVTGEMLLEITPSSGDTLPPPPDGVKPLVDGCGLVSGIIRKAARTSHLSHTERLSLLYTLGKLGDEGQNYLHQVISLCSNYDPRVTDRWIQRTDAGHPAIRCLKLKEWLGDLYPDVVCPCTSERSRSSPLDLVARSLRSQLAEELNEDSAESDIPWDEVVDEMFSGLLPEIPDETQGTRNR